MRKNLLSLALALVMCLGLTVPAFAADYTEVIPCKYAQVRNFSEGLAAVAIQVATGQSGNSILRWGFIDKTGKEVIPCKYICLYDRYPQGNPHFSEGLAMMIIDDGKDYNITNYRGKCCFIDKMGKEVIPGKYDTASNFSEGLAMVGIHRDTYRDMAGTHYTYTCGFIDKTGNEVVPLKYDAALSFSEGLAAVRIGDDRDVATWEWGYIDKTGKEVIPLRPYRLVGNFSEGLAAVAVLEGGELRYGYIDKTGQEVIPCQYRQAEDFSEGLAYVMDENERCSFIDKTGKEVISLQYPGSAGTKFSDGLAAVNLGYSRGYIDKTGQEVFSNRYNLGTETFSEGFAVVTRGSNSWGFIDKAGNEIVPCQYAETRSFSEGMAAVAIADGGSSWKDFKWGFICLGNVPVTKPEQPTESEQPTVAADSDLVIVDGVLTKYVGPGGNIVLPSSVTSIGNGAFNLCWKLTSVTIPDSVTSIGNQAFAKCGGLKSVTIPDSVTSMGAEAFSGCMNLTSVTIPGSVTSIGSYTFSGCTSLKSVTIGNGVTSIGDYAFNKCESLTSVTIPNSVTNIGEGAFHSCNSLTSVVIPSNVTNIERSAFNSCTGLTSVTISSSVTSIGEFAFNSCTNLTGVTIPSSVTSIGQYAFSSCYKLKDIYYGGTEAQWKAIQIDEYGMYTLNRGTIHYNSPMPEPTVGNFTDVKADAFYAKPVAWAVEKGVTAGTNKTTFSPNATCTQGQILTFLWRAKGEPKPIGTVSGTQYYAAAAQWAKEQGLTDNFSAEADCTRAMVVTYLWKLAGSPKAGTSNFSDVPANADYAQAVAWAVEQGVTAGTSATTFSPESVCTRGQIVTFLYRGLAK